MVIVFIIGLAVAFFLDETTNIVPGGYIVPGYLALSLTEPSRVVATLVIAFAVLGVLSCVERVMLLYGRRRFAFAVLSGAILKGLLAEVAPSFGLLPVGVLVIGFVVPGLTAHWCEKQGTLKTLCALALATALTKLIALGIVG